MSWLRLNDAARAMLLVCDFPRLQTPNGRNLAKRNLSTSYRRRNYRVAGRPQLDAIIHMGAISETTATDGDLVVETTFGSRRACSIGVQRICHTVHLCVVSRDLW